MHFNSSIRSEHFLHQSWGNIAAQMSPWNHEFRNPMDLKERKIERPYSSPKTDPKYYTWTISTTLAHDVRWLRSSNKSIIYLKSNLRGNASNTDRNFCKLHLNPNSPSRASKQYLNRRKPTQCLPPNSNRGDSIRKPKKNKSNNNNNEMHFNSSIRSEHFPHQSWGNIARETTNFGIPWILRNANRTSVMATKRRSKLWHWCSECDVQTTWKWSAREESI